MTEQNNGNPSHPYRSPRKVFHGESRRGKVYHGEPKLSGVRGNPDAPQSSRLYPSNTSETQLDSPFYQLIAAFQDPQEIQKIIDDDLHNISEIPGRRNARYEEVSAAWRKLKKMGHEEFLTATVRPDTPSDELQIAFDNLPSDVASSARIVVAYYDVERSIRSRINALPDSEKTYTETVLSPNQAQERAQRYSENPEFAALRQLDYILRVDQLLSARPNNTSPEVTTALDFLRASAHSGEFFINDDGKPSSRLVSLVSSISDITDNPHPSLTPATISNLRALSNWWLTEAYAKYNQLQPSVSHHAGEVGAPAIGGTTSRSISVESTSLPPAITTNETVGTFSERFVTDPTLSQAMSIAQKLEESGTLDRPSFRNALGSAGIDVPSQDIDEIITRIKGLSTPHTSELSLVQDGRPPEASASEPSDYRAARVRADAAGTTPGRELDSLPPSGPEVPSAPVQTASETQTPSAKVVHEGFTPEEQRYYDAVQTLTAVAQDNPNQGLGEILAIASKGILTLEVYNLLEDRVANLPDDLREQAEVIRAYHEQRVRVGGNLPIAAKRRKEKS